jgi:23S rRNA-/tRNA-specific pseudouridylate synthase
MMEQPWRAFLGENVSVCEQSDDGIVALEKPEEMLSHPNVELQASKLALLTCKYSLKFEKYLFGPDDSAIYLLNRLDAPVSGLILVALNEKISDAVKLAFEERSVEKKYLALLKGHLPSESGYWKSNVAKVNHGNYVRCESSGDFTAITRYRLIGKVSWQNIMLSFVELQPVTGRTHQLRLHCSQNCVPMVGDRTYGDFNFNKQFCKLTGCSRLFLHSNEVNIRYQCGGLSRSFHAKSKSRFANYCVDALTK